MLIKGHRCKGTSGEVAITVVVNFVIESLVVTLQCVMKLEKAPEVLP